MLPDSTVHWLDVADMVLLAGVHKLFSPCNRTPTIYVCTTYNPFLPLYALADVYGMYPVSSCTTQGVSVRTQSLKKKVTPYNEHEA